MEHIIDGSHQKLRTPDIVARTKPPKIAGILSQTYENFKVTNYHYESKMSLVNQAQSHHNRMSST